MLAEGSLHLVVDIPTVRQVLWFHRLYKVPPPHTDKFLQLRVVVVLALE